MTTSIARSARKAPAAQGVRLTDRDLELLDLLTRYGFTTATLLLRTLHKGKHRSGLYAQLARLVKVGLIEDLRTGRANQCRPRNVHALVVPTRLAYAVTGSGLTHRAPALGTLLHTLAVAEVGLLYEVGGYQVTTDRQIRSEIQAWRADVNRARKAGERFPGVPAAAAWVITTHPTGEVGSGRSGRTHAPDLVVTDADGRRWAVEVELTAKSDRDLRAVLAAFNTADKYAGVLYYTPDKAVGAKVARMVHEHTPGLAGRLQVKRYVPGHSTAT